LPNALPNALPNSVAEPVPNLVAKAMSRAMPNSVAEAVPRALPTTLLRASTAAPIVSQSRHPASDPTPHAREAVQLPAAPMHTPVSAYKPKSAADAGAQAFSNSAESASHSLSCAKRQKTQASTAGTNDVIDLTIDGGGGFINVRQGASSLDHHDALYSPGSDDHHRVRRTPKHKRLHGDVASDTLPGSRQHLFLDKPSSHTPNLSVSMFAIAKCQTLDIESQKVYDAMYRCVTCQHGPSASVSFYRRGNPLRPDIGNLDWYSHMIHASIDMLPLFFDKMICLCAVPSWYGEMRGML
jgi:hypothetical protein